MKVMEVQKSDEKLAKMAKILKAVANHNRLRIVQLLLKTGEMTVNEICEELENCEQSLLSHHLAALKEAAVLSSRREGRKIYYSSAKKEIENLMNCIENCCK
ncbi:metalloregulator ArsR/SmtB family transcription factor [uncultured Marivirga sp.]|uniref:ArsR/SmtB family transcription factor n=1 Tax=uncultured Marivirga sp. TaxID=1123707 RepID=UPI0030EDCC40|tara:strand:- start:198745 stop:199050 length:306 start_codon:yes stop_codon:yes gene_type:complete